MIAKKYVLQKEGSNPPVFLIIGSGETRNKKEASQMSKAVALRYVEAGHGKFFKRRWPIIDDAIFDF